MKKYICTTVAQILQGQVCRKQIEMKELLFLSLSRRYNLQPESAILFMGTDPQVYVLNVRAIKLQSNGRMYLCNI